MHDQQQLYLLLLALALLLQLTGCTMKRSAAKESDGRDNNIICSLQVPEEANAGEDELLFSFELDTEDDICYISHDLLLNGELMSSGQIGSADGSDLSGPLYSTILPEDLWNREDLSQLSVRLYLSDNFDNLEDMNASAAHQNEYAVKNELKNQCRIRKYVSYCHFR